MEFLRCHGSACEWTAHKFTPPTLRPVACSVKDVFGHFQVILAVSIVAVTALSSSGCRNFPRNPTQEESITLGTLAHEMNALVYIAQQQGYFGENGLAVTIKEFETGTDTTNALLQGQVDVAGCAEFIIVSRAFQKASLRSIGEIAKSEQEYVFGRIDRGVGTVTQLQGKRVGVTRQTVAEFYLGRFLDLHGLNIHQVELVDLKPADTATALANSNLDALIAWQPYARQIEQQMANQVVVWPAQSNQQLYWNLVSTVDWISNHRERVVPFLKALVQAERYVAQDPRQARAIVRERLNYDDAYMEAVWPEHQFSVTLNQSLILAMEDEARWMIQNNLTADTQVPNFPDYVYVDGLAAVNPAAVNIIR